jgi:hypothetical protein
MTENDVKFYCRGHSAGARSGGTLRLLDSARWHGDIKQCCQCGGLADFVDIDTVHPRPIYDDELDDAVVAALDSELKQNGGGRGSLTLDELKHTGSVHLVMQDRLWDSPLEAEQLLKTAIKRLMRTRRIVQDDRLRWEPGTNSYDPNSRQSAWTVPSRW